MKALSEWPTYGSVGKARLADVFFSNWHVWALQPYAILHPYARLIISSLYASYVSQLNTAVINTFGEWDGRVTERRCDSNPRSRTQYRAELSMRAPLVTQPPDPH